MKLMTKELEKRFKEVGSQENVKDPVIIAKYFNPAGAGTWYATEYNPDCLLYTSPSPRDRTRSRMPSSA